MTNNRNQTNTFINALNKKGLIDDQFKQMEPLDQDQINHLDFTRFNPSPTKKGQDDRLDYLNDKGIVTDEINAASAANTPEIFKGNIENYIGMARIPIGLSGPLLLNGIHANGDYHVPLATTEGALVASYHRGMKACRLSGGITVACLSEGVQRCPFFKFNTLAEVGLFLIWVYDNISVFKEIVSQSSRYALLKDVKSVVEGNSVILTFEYTTGDASGQNMVTFCTDQVCQHILSHFEIQPVEWYIESNYSGDKKATSVSYSHVRGKKVTAEIVIPQSICEKTLKSTPQKIANYWQSSTLATVQSGAIGAQGHIANGLTALFIACGQDVACVSESSIGLTRMEVNTEGNLYLSLTLPSLIVGTIGGGTKLPTQKECLDMLRCMGNNSAVKFAEICCGVALAGELSIAAALSSNQFTNAHQKLGRNK